MEEEDKNKYGAGAAAAAAAKMIIAMKGHPGTGKSTLARSLASTLGIPLVDKDDIRDSTSSLQHQSLLPPSLLNQFSYDVVWNLVSTQVNLGLSVIVDSPLSSRTHLDRLLQLASSSSGGDRPDVRLVVVECKPTDQGEWRRRLETRERSWHKPSTWGDLERLIEEYGGRTDYDVGNVPKLVVDTTGAVGVEKLVSGVIDFILAHS